MQLRMQLRDQVRLLKPTWRSSSCTLKRAATRDHDERLLAYRTSVGTGRSRYNTHAACTQTRCQALRD